jgi:hypothetical protein
MMDVTFRYYKNQKSLPAAVLYIDASTEQPAFPHAFASGIATIEIEITEDEIGATCYLRSPEEIACWKPSTREELEQYEERLRAYYPGLPERFWSGFLDQLQGGLLESAQLREEWLAKRRAKKLWTEIRKRQAQAEKRRQPDGNSLASSSEETA